MFINFKDSPALSPLHSKVKNKNAIPLWPVKAENFDKWRKALSPDHRAWLAQATFSAKASEVLKFPGAGGKISAVAVGLGKDNDMPHANGWAFSAVSKSLKDGSYYIDGNLDNNDATLAAFSWAMAHYKFDRYLDKKAPKPPRLHLPKNADGKLVNILLRATCLVRDLVNTPACDLGPDDLANVVQEMAKNFKAKVVVTTGDALLKKGLEAIHTVGRAAEKAPRLIDMTWGKKDAPRLTLVGKGVCFDTGGLDIKISPYMLLMKKDMGGAAHALALAQMIMEAGLDVRLRLLIPAVENNIAGNAFRPGDIIRTYKGTTVEVGNTDAEGRLVLCDALTLGSEDTPDLMIDFATLTGAARVAVGADIYPFFTDNADFAAKLPEHAQKSGEEICRLPLYTPYAELLDSPIADLNNIGNDSMAGALTAALFLKHFVSDPSRWAHFDIYAWNRSGRPGRPKGGEAMALRSVFSYLYKRYKK